MNEWKKNFSFYTEEDIKFRFLRDRFLNEKKYKKIMFIFFKKKKSLIIKSYQKNC